MGGLSIAASSAPKTPFVGITFRCEAPGDTHVGLALRQKSSLSVLHLQTHKYLALDAAPNKRDVVVLVPLPRARIRATIRYARRFHQVVGKSLPYNFRLPNDVFDEQEGKLLLRRGEGLTCATLPIVMLRATGVQLLRTEQWPSRPQDMERHRQLVEVIRKGMLERNEKVHQQRSLTPDDLEHLAYMNTQVDAVRFRPEEVAAAAGQELPASFSDVVAGAALLLQEYDQMFPAMKV